MTLPLNKPSFRIFSTRKKRHPVYLSILKQWKEDELFTAKPQLPRRQATTLTYTSQRIRVTDLCLRSHLYEFVIKRYIAKPGPRETKRESRRRRALRNPVPHTTSYRPRHRCRLNNVFDIEIATLCGERIKREEGERGTVAWNEGKRNLLFRRGSNPRRDYTLSHTLFLGRALFRPSSLLSSLEGRSRRGDENHPTSYSRDYHRSSICPPCVFSVYLSSFKMEIITRYILNIFPNLSRPLSYDIII